MEAVKTLEKVGVAPRVVHAPRGTKLTCKGWGQEAAMRMLMNNLDPEVAGDPENLIVYGGRGKAARNWECFYAIVEALKELENDETLLVQSGKPVGIFRTHPDAPRVLLANSNLVPAWATQEVFDELDRKGLIMYGQMTAGSWIYIGTQGILQGTYETLGAAARAQGWPSLKGKFVLTAGLGEMGGAQPLAITMNEGVGLIVEVDPKRAQRRLDTRYVDVVVNDLDEALRMVEEAARKAGAPRNWLRKLEAPLASHLQSARTLIARSRPTDARAGCVAMEEVLKGLEGGAKASGTALLDLWEEALRRIGDSDVSPQKGRAASGDLVGSWAILRWRLDGAGLRRLRELRLSRNDTADTVLRIEKRGEEYVGTVEQDPRFFDEMGGLNSVCVRPPDPSWKGREMLRLRRIARASDQGGCGGYGYSHGLISERAGVHRHAHDGDYP